MADDRPLTQKQEAFALAYFETGSGAEAYRRAYDVAEAARDEWIYVEASLLLDRPKVAQRVKQLSEQAAKLAIYTRHKAMEELEEARQEAKKNAQAAAMVGATSAKIKLLGLDKPGRLELTSPDGSMSPKPAFDMSRLSDTALAEIVAAADAIDAD